MPGRSAVPLVLMLAVGLSGACASTGARPAPFPRPGAGAAIPAQVTPPDAVVQTALALRGVPYRDGGTDPSGFDCSGFVAYVLAQHGVSVPRTVAGQYALGSSVRARSLRAGDLVFFSTIAAGPSHVGIALSSREFVHAPSSAGVVRIEDLWSPYWSSRFAGARRLR